MTELAGRLTVSNPVPQLPPGASSPRDNAALLHVAPNKSKYSTPSDKIVLILVGLPARGKTFVARKVHRYLEFFHAVNVRLFNIGNYRRKLLGDHHPAEWFDPKNETGARERKLATDAALGDLSAWLAEENDGRVAILDGTHSTLAKRNYAYDKLRKLDCKVIFLESICSDRDVVERNIVSCKLGTPDYVGMSERDAVEDFRRRVAQYESNYETIDADCLDGAESNRSWIKIIDCRRFVINNIRGYMPGRLVQFLSHLHMEPHVFYFSRHGQSEYNVLGKIGGDSGLSAAGDAYAKKLAEFCVSEVTKAPDGSERPARLWTSTMRRTRETAAYIAHEKTHIDYEATAPPRAGVIRYLADELEGRPLRYFRAALDDEDFDLASLPRRFDMWLSFDPRDKKDILPYYFSSRNPGLPWKAPHEDADDEAHEYYALADAHARGFVVKRPTELGEDRWNLVQAAGAGRLRGVIDVMLQVGPDDATSRFSSCGCELGWGVALVEPLARYLQAAREGLEDDADVARDHCVLEVPDKGVAAARAVPVGDATKTGVGNLRGRIVDAQLLRGCSYRAHDYASAWGLDRDEFDVAFYGGTGARNLYLGYGVTNGGIGALGPGGGGGGGGGGAAAAARTPPPRRR
ncbi:6-phosphofructo-2-kinase [Aureococcus anophagefferens]|nr:6-phosphofructo-2-kinase [Aureococcus anophagefferens]